MISSHRSIVHTVAVALFAMASIATAHASAIDDAAPSVTVRYHDLNLSTAEGVASLYARIRYAADEVCGPLDSRDPERKQTWRNCVSHAVAEAVNTVHNRNLSAYHLHRIRDLTHHEFEAPTTVASR
jgi:UrcA family protein